MNKNDEKILKLKKLAAQQEEELKKAERFLPITNCSLRFEGSTHNIHTLQKEQIVDLLVRVNVYAMSAKQLGLDKDYKINGFTPKDWITDLNGRLAYVSRKEKEEKLKKTQDTLHKLLSEEKKVELTLEEIEASLNE